jgi:hypothetical protein
MIARHGVALAAFFTQPHPQPRVLCEHVSTFIASAAPMRAEPGGRMANEDAIMAPSLEHLRGSNTQVVHD